VIAQSVRVSSTIFFGSSNAVRNLRNDFPTRPRQPTSKADCESFFCDSVRQVVVFLSLRFMPVRHARFHRTSKLADIDNFGGFVDENDAGFYG
jgi:hypothetical protein